MQVPLRATKISFFQPYFSCTPDSTTNKAFSRHSVSKAEQKSKYSCSTKATTGQKQGRFWYAMHRHTTPTTWSRLQRNVMSLPICICHH